MRLISAVVDEEMRIFRKSICGFFVVRFVDFYNYEIADFFISNHFNRIKNVGAQIEIDK